MFRKKDKNSKAAGTDQAYGETAKSYGGSPKGGAVRKALIFLALLLVIAFVAVPASGKFGGATPAFLKSSDDRLHKLEMEMVKIKSLQERMTNLEIAVAKKFGQLQSESGKPIKDEVSDLSVRMEELEKKIASAGPARRTR